MNFLAVARTWRLGRAGWVLLLGGALIAALFAIPLGYLVSRNVHNSVWETWTASRTTAALFRTLALATSVSIACALVGTTLAWLVTRTNLIGRRIWRVLFVLPLVIPSFVAALALVAAFSSGGLADDLFGLTAFDMRGFWAAFFVLTLISYPYVYLPVFARLVALPASLEDSARSLGDSPAVVFRRIVLPQTSGAIGAGSLLVFLYVLSDFGAVSLLRYDTLAIRIYSTRLFDPSTSLAQGLLLASLALVVVGTQRIWDRKRSKVEAVAAGQRPRVINLGRWQAPSLALASIVVGLALVAPVAVLADWGRRGFDSSRLGGQAVELTELINPIINTAGASVTTAFVVVLVVLPIAYLVGRYASRGGAVLSSLVVAAFAMPGLVIALAVASWILQAPVVGGLYQTFPLLVYAYVVHFGAQALAPAEVAVGGIPRRLDDAARSLGAGRLRRFLTIDTPLLLPGLVAGSGLVLLATMKELPATLLLAPTGFDTLATRTWQASEGGLLAEAGLTALVLLAASAVLTWLLTIRRMQRMAS